MRKTTTFYYGQLFDQLADQLLGQLFSLFLAIIWSVWSLIQPRFIPFLSCQFTINVNWAHYFTRMSFRSLFWTKYFILDGLKTRMNSWNISYFSSFSASVFKFVFKFHPFIMCMKFRIIVCRGYPTPLF